MIFSRSKACFNYQIGLCPGVCVNAINKKEYAICIRNISLFFRGKKSALLLSLKKEMQRLVKEEQFEKASSKRDQIWALQHIKDVSLLKRDTDKLSDNKRIFRIEAYDIAHMSGKHMVGVMVVMEDGELNNNEYRKFIIKGFNASNDTGALGEMLSRRVSHNEWQSAQMIVIDGGQAQLNVAQKFFDKAKIVSVMKDERHQARELIGDSLSCQNHRRQIIQINAEAHRYAIAFHKTRRNKGFLPYRG
jgi:excinuclease ABC subunit C